jgi:hypothetical protein
VFAWRDLGYGDLDQSLRPGVTKLRKSGSNSSSGRNYVTEIRTWVIEIWIKIFIQQD